MTRPPASGEPQRFKRRDLRGMPMPSVVQTTREIARAAFFYSGTTEVEVCPKTPGPGHCTVKVSGPYSGNPEYIEARIAQRLPPGHFVHVTRG